jgi:hypothetical protein
MSAYLRDHGHKESRKAKEELVANLKTKVTLAESSCNPDHVKIYRLKQDLKKAEKQLEHMRP